MYRISELAEKVGLSRTALLYYEKLGLIRGERLSNGYRIYGDTDIQHIRLIQQLQQGGLSLKECKACIEDKIDTKLIQSRLATLDKEIAQKQEARELLSSMLGFGDEQAWHETAMKSAPDAHFKWLLTQGFDEKEALRIKWLSKNMTQHDEYMNDFMRVYSKLERWGPGGENETLKALSALPTKPENVLEIGCGKGAATFTLAKHLSAKIIAVDNEQAALDSLDVALKESGLERDRKSTRLNSSH